MQQMIPPAMPRQVPPGWWQRNWKLGVPLGCLGAIALLAAFVLLILSIVFGAMKSSDAYKLAFARASADAGVIKAIGTPVKDGFFTTGNIRVNGSSGFADLAVPISGPKGKATIYLVAAKSEGIWNFSKLAVTIKQPSHRIDLLKQPADETPVERAR